MALLQKNESCISIQSPIKTLANQISIPFQASFRTGYRGNESFSREMNTIKRFPIRTLSAHSFSRPSNVRLRKPSFLNAENDQNFRGLCVFEILKKAFRQTQLKISSLKSCWASTAGL